MLCISLLELFVTTILRATVQSLFSGCYCHATPTHIGSSKFNLAAIMSLFHSIKRTVVKGKNITQDPVFDKLCAQFKDIEKQSLNMQMAMKDR
jgi:hypothetical protein